MGNDRCEKIRSSIKKKIRRKLFGIKNLTLCSLIYEELKELVNDSHFAISVCGRKRRFVQKYIAYVTDIAVRKTAEECYEIICGNDIFPKGYLFCEKKLKEYLLPTIIVGKEINKNDKCYLLGKYTNEEISGIELKGKLVQTHRIRADNTVNCEDKRFISKENYVIINHRSYDMPFDEEFTVY